jgi:membrane-associated protease RseP (regulator of RpoE activity)
MKKKLFVIPLVAAMALALGSPASAQQPQVASPAPAAMSAPTWLGVAIGPVPQAVQAQLPDTMDQGQGLMVMRVVPGSPAERGGIRQHDVLVAFNGDKLFSPNDLVERVRNAKAGDKVALEVIRHGKPVKVEVELASRQPPANLRRPPSSPPMQASPSTGKPRVESRVWENFQSLSVVKNPDGKYSAVVEFLDSTGNKKRFEYEGTRDEISTQVKKEKELPDPLKQQLLDALSDRMPALPMDFPPFPEMPDFRALERELFAPPPWFRQQGRPGF